MVITLTACGGNEEEVGDGEPVPAENADVTELNIAWNAQPPTMDPMMTVTGATIGITRNIFEPLVTLDEDSELQPVLAESWTIEDDGATIVFSLRDDVVFHDGQQMTAEDVAASLTRWMDVTQVGQDFFAGATAEVTNDLEVTLRTPEAMFASLYMIGEGGDPAPIMPASVIEEATAEGVQDFVGTGPYSLENWAPDQHIHLVRNEDYTRPDGEPSGMAGDRTGTFENIYYQFVTDASTRISGIQSGEYDAAVRIPLDNVEQLESNDELQVWPVDHALQPTAVLNKAEGPLSDVTMRQAINAAIDVEELLIAGYVDESFFDMNGSLYIEGTPWYSESGLENYNVNDPELAEELLEEAGYDGETIRILTTRDYDDYYHIAVMMEQQLTEVGIEVELMVVDWATLLEMREDPTAHEISMTSIRYQATPANLWFFSPDESGWTDDEAIFDARDAIIYATDEEVAQEEGTDALQQAFYDYLPVLRFGDHQIVTVMRKDLAGFEAPPGVGGEVFFRVYPTEE